MSCRKNAPRLKEAGEHSSNGGFVVAKIIIGSDDQNHDSPPPRGVILDALAQQQACDWCSLLRLNLCRSKHQQP
jgi:hypothetical protein